MTKSASDGRSNRRDPTESEGLEGKALDCNG
jgi:hypothetical protein